MTLTTNSDEKAGQEEDPVVQYLIVRRDLPELAGIGALAVQTAHAAQAPITSQLKNTAEVLDQDTAEWALGIFTKILLEVRDERELVKLANKLQKNGIEANLISESALYGSPTALGIKPYRKSHIQRYVRKLSLFGIRPRAEFYLNGELRNLREVTYSPTDINLQQPDYPNRFVLRVPLETVVEKYGAEFKDAMKFYANQGGTEDTEYDTIATPDLRTLLSLNHPAATRHLISDHYEGLLAAGLNKNNSGKIAITSLDGIFTDTKQVNIYGGCNKLP